jgi:hypothetical protein
MNAIKKWEQECHDQNIRRETYVELKMNARKVKGDCQCEMCDGIVGYEFLKKALEKYPDPPRPPQRRIAMWHEEEGYFCNWKYKVDDAGKYVVGINNGKKHSIEFIDFLHELAHNPNE